MILGINKNQFKLHIIIFIWGFTGVLGKLITIEGATLAWIRMGIAFLGLAIFMFVKKISFSTPRKDLISMLVVGLIIAIHWATFFIAIKVSTVSVALVCMSSSALFMSFLEPLLMRKKLVPYEMIFGAVVVLALWLIFEVESTYALGIGLGIFSAFCAALFTALNAILIKKHNATKITTYEMLGGFIGLGIYLVFVDGFNGEDWLPTFSDWIYLLLLGLVCTAYAFEESIEIMKTISPFTIAISVNLEPIYAILMALVIFGEEEHMSPLFYVGALILILTILANALLKSKQRKKQRINV
jgi:drug/metabolite transporter (DMT)-like permease